MIITMMAMMHLCTGVTAEHGTLVVRKLTGLYRDSKPRGAGKWGREVS